MRVVQVANFYGPRSGGLRTAVDRLGAEYCAAGHEVFLVVPGPDSQCTVMDSGVVRMSVPARRIPFAGGYRAVLPRPVTMLLDDLSPDAIEVSDRFTLRGLGHWGSSRGVRTVMISHERLDRLTGQFLPSRIARGLADVANRRTAGQYDTVLCTTAFARAEFDRIGATNVATVPLGVDLDMFHPRRFCRDVRRQWAAPEELLLVHCGRLSMEKRADRSIDTVGALRDSGVNARLLIIGDGPLRPRLERHAARLPVTFTGFIDQRDTVADLLATADVALAPGPHETFGLAALEALASGTPAVVSRTSALREVLTTDSGVCADNHPDALAAAVRTIIERPEVQRRRDARRQAEHFTWSSSAQGMLDALGTPGI
ncbi:glycosyltransferase [soil metagenome]